MNTYATAVTQLGLINKKKHGVNIAHPHVLTCLQKFVKKKRQTSLLRYGVDNPAKSKVFSEKAKKTISGRTEEQQHAINERRKITTQERYGVDNIYQLKENQDKVKATCLMAYGVDNPAKSADIKKKIEVTNKERYGTKAPAQNPEIQAKIQKTNIERYGVNTYLLDDSLILEMKHKSKKDFFNLLINGSRLQGRVTPLFSYEDYDPTREKYYEYEWECCQCKTHFMYFLENGVIPRCPKCYPLLVSGKSMVERELKEEIEKRGIKGLSNIRGIVGSKEIDLYFPELKVAIEFNGIFWHSETYKKDHNAHLNKTKSCNEMGIDLIHVWEWHWLNKRDIILSVIMNRLGCRPQHTYYARGLSIKEVPYTQEKEFLEANHLQGYTHSRVCLGLYQDEVLIQVVSFGKPRFNKKYEWEIIRSCTLLNVRVTGGFSKLLKNFIKSYQPNSIITYCDRSIFNGSGYLASGFKQVKSSPPAYWYTKHHKTLENRMGYQKHMLSKKLEIFDPNLTEWENMQSNNFDRIWDCGNLVFEWKQ